MSDNLLDVVHELRQLEKEISDYVIKIEKALEKNKSEYDTGRFIGSFYVLSKIKECVCKIDK